MNTIRTLMAISLVFFSHLALSKSLVVDDTDKKVSFVAVGKPAMLKIKGEGSQLNLKVDDNEGVVNGTIEFKIDSLSTGIEMRDSHMKEKYLESTKFPDAKIELKDFKLTKSTNKLDSALTNVAFKAPLTLHGVTKDVEGTYSIEPAGSLIKVHASYELKVTDFGIQIPSYMGITIADKVTVETSFAIKK